MTEWYHPTEHWLVWSHVHDRRYMIFRFPQQNISRIRFQMGQETKYGIFISKRTVA